MFIKDNLMFLKWIQSVHVGRNLKYTLLYDVGVCTIKTISVELVFFIRGQ